MLKMKDLLEEGRKIQETFKKNVLREQSATIKSKFTPLLSVRDGGDWATLMTPFGTITFETPGDYDTYDSGGASMGYSNPKGGITQSELKRAADKIFDFVSDEPNYLEALKKLLDPKVLAKYMPKIKQVVGTTPKATKTISAPPDGKEVKPKFTSLLRVRDGGDSATLMTPFGSITIETAGEYDTYDSSGASLGYTKPKGGITQSEWQRAADKIYDYVLTQPNYFKALEKLTDPKVLAKYIPKIKTLVK